jgi:type II secretion system protein H
MNRDRSKSQGFTLIEIMMVVAIMGIVLAIGIPSIYHMVHKESLSSGVRDVVEVCSNARAQAILRGVEMHLVIHPRDGRFEVRAAGGGAPAETHASEPEFNPRPAPSPQTGGLASSAQLSDQVLIEMLDINFAEYKDADEAYVRFFPNGTSDEFTLVLHSDRNEYRKISLEVVTALANVDALQ